MSARPVSVRLVADATGFAERLTLIRDAASSFNARLALDSATWEPHDWNTFNGGES